MNSIVFLSFLLYAICLAAIYSVWKLMRTHVSEEQEAYAGFSIIIPVRNEEKYLGALLEAIYAQEYPSEKFEIIVVNDNSTDGTAMILEDFKRRYPDSFHHQELELTEDFIGGHKKAAITQAINTSKFDWILCTDGDCLPGKHWLQAFNEKIYYENEVNFISGPVTFFQPKSLFDKILAIEFSSLIGVGAVSMAAGKPTMCNAANMAFRKSVFHAIQGYEGYAHLPSGDDEFLLQKISSAFPGSAYFLKNAGALIFTAPPHSLDTLIQQRIRWASKWKQHKSIVPAVVAILVFAFQLLVLALPFFWIAGMLRPDLLLASLALKLFFEAIFLKSVLDFFGDFWSWRAFLVTFLLHPLYVVACGIMANVGTYQWKGRKFNT